MFSLWLINSLGIINKNIGLKSKGYGFELMRYVFSSEFELLLTKRIPSTGSSTYNISWQSLFITLATISFSSSTVR